MIPVRVTVSMGRNTVNLDDVKDQRIVSALRQAARDVGAKLEAAKCPTHVKGPSDVRLHVDARGGTDLKYQSCCEQLGEAVSKIL